MRAAVEAARADAASSSRAQHRHEGCRADDRQQPDRPARTRPRARSDKPAEAAGTTPEVDEAAGAPSPPRRSRKRQKPRDSAEQRRCPHLGERGEDERARAQGLGGGDERTTDGARPDGAKLLTMKVGVPGRVDGAVGRLQWLVAAADPTTHCRACPCAWITLYGQYRKGAPGCGPCEREASGTTAKALPAGVLAQVKKACSPALLAKMVT
eukprot:3311187-Pleurochrysis_carterae.AAC.1